MSRQFCLLWGLVPWVALLYTRASAATRTELIFDDVTVIPMDKDAGDEHQVVTPSDKYGNIILESYG